MAEPDRTQNSVLTSLQELQRLEAERIERERLEAQRRVEEEARLKAEEEARLKAEEEARRRAEEEAKRRAEEERERREREERMRLAEADRKARIDAEMKLQKERIKAEAEAKALEKKVPWVPIGMAIAVLVVGLGGVGYYAWQQSKQSDIERQARIAAEKERERFQKELKEREAFFQSQQEALEREKAALARRLATAKSEAEREMIRKQQARQVAKARDLAAQRARARAAARRKAKRLKRATGSDPLGGLNL